MYHRVIHRGYLFNRIRDAICFLERNRGNFNRKRKVELYNAAETFAKDEIRKCAKSLRQDEKFVFQIESTFPADFFRIRNEYWKLQSRMCEE